MTSADLLADAFGRIQEEVHHAVRGITPEALSYRVDPDANTIAWLVWHLTRIQDDHVAGAAGIQQVWTAQGWADRFALPFPVGATGYGHTSTQVAAVKSGAALLTGYYDAVHAQTIRYVESLTDPDLDRIVDRSWNPPVTLSVRLVSVIADDLEHVGQALLIRGILHRQR